MREDRMALRGGKARQINDDGVEPLLQQMLGNSLIGKPLV
jgi:hypothetical protein